MINKEQKKTLMIKYKILKKYQLIFKIKNQVKYLTEIDLKVLILKWIFMDLYYLLGLVNLSRFNLFQNNNNFKIVYRRRVLILILINSKLYLSFCIKLFCFNLICFSISKINY